MPQRTFVKGAIEGVLISPLTKFVDTRGWLAELWRSDKVEPTYHPAMTYVSQTEPGVTRGPHEHTHQADLFCFLGPGNFEITLWDNRQDSPTYNHTQVFVVGQDAPKSVLIPPGVVHGYKNVSSIPGIVINSPNQLYMGEHYSQEIDEIRHEADPDSPFVIASGHS